jgi:glutathione peroxidase
MNTETVYDFNARTPQGKEITLSKYKGKVLLIVNTATRCGFAYQFEGLEELHRKYKDGGLVVLGFPCDQFNNQEPESNENMELVCKTNFGVSFQLFEKTVVNGKNAHSLFRFLKSKLKGFPGNRIKWNFTKFLIDRNGKPVKRFSPLTKPEMIEKQIKKLLEK